MSPLTRILTAAVLYLAILILSAPKEDSEPRRTCHRDNSKKIKLKIAIVNLAYFLAPAAIIALSGLTLMTYGYGNFIVGWSISRLFGSLITCGFRDIGS